MELPAGIGPVVCFSLKGRTGLEFWSCRRESNPRVVSVSKEGLGWGFGVAGGNQTREPLHYQGGDDPKI